MTTRRLNIELEAIPDGTTWIILVRYRRKQVAELAIEASSADEALVRAQQTITLEVGGDTHSLAEWVMRKGRKPA